jgi:hypothetical protein
MTYKEKIWNYKVRLILKMQTGENYESYLLNLTYSTTWPTCHTLDNGILYSQTPLNSLLWLVTLKNENVIKYKFGSTDLYLYYIFIFAT